ncbi:MAG: DUF4838 domain-containing protein [Thermoanaerobacterium sp.]|nr:DUF4838 domain-containing protein [Thermoanaerobacterium sp.]
MIENIDIVKMHNNETLDFACQELQNYLIKMNNNIKINITENRENTNKTNKIYIGLFTDMDWINAIEVDDPYFDDAIVIDFENGKGNIAGANPRSVLIAVYRFLYEAGCRWIRPGNDGEYIPSVNIEHLKVHVMERPSYRHRGICIEGAVSYENVYDIIDFLPKIGLNSYFIQFKEAFEFFDRWYSHKNNPYKEKEQFSLEKAKEYVVKLEKEIKKRNLIYHAVGHGWTCEALGIPGIGWGNYNKYIPEDTKKYFAEINGKRELWDGIPINTNLCYSNYDVRKMIVDGIVKYLESHPNVDVLHFWLADGYNNHCECDECKKMIPSDYYIKMLNELDEELTLKNINTKIVFLIYVDLFWPPQNEKIKNKDRFIMMFAPIMRVYTDNFKPTAVDVPLKPYVRNKLEYPKSIPENVAYLNAWQKVFNRDSFLFDYHFMWEHLYDPGYFGISELLYKDIVNLNKVGLNGLLSCQLQRAFFPTGLGVYVLGKALWNNQVTFQEIVDEYFTASFGEDADKCKIYLNTLSNLFDSNYLRSSKERINAEDAKLFSSIVEYVDKFRPVIKKHLINRKRIMDVSWKYIDIHAEYITLFAEMLSYRAEGDNTAMYQKWEKLKKFLQQEEDLIQPVFDVYQFIKTIGDFI